MLDAAVGHADLRDLDDEVDVAADLPVGVLRRCPADALDGEVGETFDGVGRGHGVHGADRSDTGLHGLEHRVDLTASDFADDDALRVEAQAGFEQLHERDLAGLTAVRRPLPQPGPVLQRGDDVVAIAHPVQVQLAFLLDRHDLFHRVDLVAQRPHEGGLAGARVPGDHDRASRADDRAQQLRHRRCHGTELEQLVEADVHEAVDAHDDLGAGRDRRVDGLETADAAGKVHRQNRVGAGERSGVLALAHRDQADLFDQVLVGRGDRRHQHLPPVRVLHVDAVVAVDVDVLHRGVVDERLEPSQPVQSVDHCSSETLLHGCRPGVAVTGLRGHRVHPVADHVQCVALRDRPLVLLGHRGVDRDRAIEQLGDLFAEALQQGPVNLLVVVLVAGSLRRRRGSR